MQTYLAEARKQAEQAAAAYSDGAWHKGWAAVVVGAPRLLLEHRLLHGLAAPLPLLRGLPPSKHDCSASSVARGPCAPAADGSGSVSTSSVGTRRSLLESAAGLRRRLDSLLPLG